MGDDLRSVLYLVTVGPPRVVIITFHISRGWLHYSPLPHHSRRTRFDRSFPQLPLQGIAQLRSIRGEVRHAVRLTYVDERQARYSTAEGGLLRSESVLCSS